jgi:hypothetical protein
MQNSKAQKIPAPLKIKNKKGDLYVVCPFLERLQQLMRLVCGESSEHSNELFEFNRTIDGLREIAKVWQSEYDNKLYNGKYSAVLASSNIALPYEFSAVIKTLKIRMPDKIDLINEVVKTYL